MKEVIETEKFKKEYEKVKEQAKGKHVIGSVDRRSPLSGVVEKFVGYKRFLKRYPDLKNRIILIQVLSSLNIC